MVPAPLLDTRFDYKGDPLLDTRAFRCCLFAPCPRESNPAHDKEINLVRLKYCPETNPSPSLQKAAARHAVACSRLRTHSLINPNRDNKVTMRTILLIVAGKEKESLRWPQAACSKERTLN
eukprot:scaffold90306_cov16-Tisochrysis_lutea.AAC.1